MGKRIEERPELLKSAGEDERALAHLKARLIFCGRYSLKAGTPLDTALDNATAGLAAAADTASKLGGRGKLQMTIAQGTFGDDHLACRGQAFPYRPSVSASHGTRVIEARSAEENEVAK